ncbi:MAG: hypothetical protein ACPGVG_20640, partial [Mycobacterium sp.]
MSDASDLGTYMKAMFETNDLMQLTNFRDSAAVAIDDTVLENATTRAILWFKQKVTNYAPGTYDMHDEIAAHYALGLLYRRTQQFDLA